MRIAGLFLIALAIVGCGGGGGAAPGDGGGNQVTNAGPLRVEGRVNTPQSAVIGGLTTHVINGDISAATLNDLNPTPAETEVFFSSKGNNGFEISATNADGDGPVRSVLSDMPQPAFQLVPDPLGRYLYFVRNNNLQRVDVRDGTSNTLVSAVATYAINGSGTKFLYRKAGTPEMWTANANGSGQTFLRNETTSTEIFGGTGDVFTLRSLQLFKTLDISTNVGSGFNDFAGFPIFWTVFSPSERAIYVYGKDTSISKFRLFRAESPNTATFHDFFEVIRNDTDSLLRVAAAGDPQSFVGLTDMRDHLRKVDVHGQVVHEWPFDSDLRAVAWAPNRTTCPLLGPGTPYSTGGAALIASELGVRTPSVLMADAVTRNSLTVTSLNDGPNGNPLYRIDCDNLKTLAYGNANGYAWKTVVGSATGLKGAIVSFDATTGAVANLITFSKRPIVTRQGQGWRVEGELDTVTTPNGGAKRAVSGLTIR